jgi:hypothetical protein
MWLCRMRSLCLVMASVGWMGVTVASTVPDAVVLAAEQTLSIQEQRDGLLQNAEEMVAHGGMGDAKAILHHCGEAARYAEALTKQVPTASPQRDETIASLNDVMKHCKRVAEIGIHADPGVLLNPAIKARTAARAAVKAFGLAK